MTRWVSELRAYAYLREVVLVLVSLASIALALEFAPRGTWTYVALAAIVGAGFAIAWRWIGFTRTAAGLYVVLGIVLTVLSSLGQVSSIQDSLRGPSVAITRQFGLPSETRGPTIVRACPRESCPLRRHLPARTTVFMDCWLDVRPAVEGSPRWFEVSLDSVKSPPLGFTPSRNIVEQASTPHCRTGHV